MKNSWKGYESFSLVALFILIAMSVYMLIQGNFSFFEPEVKFLKSVVDFIDFQKYFIAIILIGVFYFFMYYIAVYKFSMKAQKEQRQAIIDARTISEINADVAGDIMNDTLDDFEVHR
jgi:heme/copper-type cytochrome/quinol oxidase subunit 2